MQLAEKIHPSESSLQPSSVVRPLGMAAVSFVELDTVPWTSQAACLKADQNSFFPEKGGSTRDAKRICEGCDVRDECLEYALDNDERFGVWGGMSERERRKLKKLAS